MILADSIGDVPLLPVGRPINTVTSLWRGRFGRPIRKLCLRVGATCPNRDGTLGHGGCAFCDFVGGPLPSVPEQLRLALASARPSVGLIAYVQDHSATYVKVEQLRAALRAVLDESRVVAIAIGTRPDCLPPEVVRLLVDVARERPLWVELGLQSASDTTLRLLNRKHTVACFAGATRALMRAGIPVCAHVILGAPTLGPAGELVVEGLADAAQSAALLAQLDVFAVKLHNCHVLAGTHLATLYHEGRFRPLSVEEYVDQLIHFLERVPAAMEVHRLVGDASPPALLAPEFTANKQLVLRRIYAACAARRTYQGRVLGSGAQLEAAQA